MYVKNSLSERIPMPDIYDRKLTQKQIDQLSGSMELDLIAYFNQLRDEILNVIDKDSRNNSTPGELMKDISALLEG